MPATCSAWRRLTHLQTAWKCTFGLVVWLCATPLLLAQPGAALGQEAEQTNPVVSQIRIEGNQTIPTDRIQDYLRLRVGREFSFTKVENDVRSLLATRMFVDVKPLYERTPQGVIVIFRVIERPVIREIQYVGNASVKDSDLTEETRIEIGDAVDPASIAEGRRRIEELYKRRGYNHVQVEILEGNQSGDRRVVYRIHEGPKQRIQWISFVGNTVASDGRLRQIISSSAAWFWYFGGEYDPGKIDLDIEQLLSYYHGLGYWSARVSREVKMNATRSAVYVTFVIHEGPRFHIRNIDIVGNNVFSIEQLQSKLKLKPGMPFSQRMLQADVSEMKDTYGSDGYIFADVQPDIRFLEEPGKLDIIYDISEGAQYRVGRINVVIKGDHPHTKITTVLNRLSIKPGDIVDIRELRDSERRLQAAGIFRVDRARGIAPKIVFGPPDMKGSQVASNPRGRDIRGQDPGSTNPLGSPALRTVNLQIQKGEPAQQPQVQPRLLSPVPRSFQVYEPTWLEELQPPPPDFRRPGLVPNACLELAPQDEFFIGEVIDQVRQELEQHHGSIETERPYWAERPHSVQYPPAERPRLVRGQDFGRSARTVPQRRTNARTAEWIRRGQSPNNGPYIPANQPPPAVPNFPQQPQPPNTFPGEEPERFVPNDPNTFNGDVSDVDDWIGEPTQDFDVVVEETETGRFLFGVGVNSDAGVVGNIVLDEQNFDITRLPNSFQDILNGTAFRGAGQRFRLEASPGSEVSRYVVSFTDPYFLDTQNSFGVHASYFERFFREYDEERLSLRVQVGRAVTPDLSAQLTARYEQIQLSNPATPTPPALAEAVGTNDLVGLRAALIHDTRDSPFLPTEGHYWDLSFEQVLGDFDYPRAIIEARQYFLVYQRPDQSGRHTLSVRGQLGFSGSDTPIYDHFFAGGFSTLRGFDFRGASPRVGNVVVGGEFLALGSVEYLFPLTADEMLRGVVFSDFGTVEEDVRFDADTFRVAPGFGLRINLAAFGPAPIALDFAFPVANAPGDEERIFNFYLGLVR